MEGWRLRFPGCAAAARAAEAGWTCVGAVVTLRALRELEERCLREGVGWVAPPGWEAEVDVEELETTLADWLEVSMQAVSCCRRDG